MDCTSTAFMFMAGSVLLTGLTAYFFYSRKVSEMTETIQVLEDDVVLLHQKNKDLEAVYESVASTKNTLEGEISLMQRKNQDLTVVNESITLHNHNLTKELSELENQVIQLNNDNHNLRVQLEVAQQAQNQHLTELKGLNNEALVMKYRVQALTDELQNMKNASDKQEREKLLLMDAYKLLQKKYATADNHKNGKELNGL